MEILNGRQGHRDRQHKSIIFSNSVIPIKANYGAHRRWAEERVCLLCNPLFHTSGFILSSWRNPYAQGSKQHAVLQHQEFDQNEGWQVKPEKLRFTVWDAIW